MGRKLRFTAAFHAGIAQVLGPCSCAPAGLNVRSCCPDTAAYWMGRFRKPRPASAIKPHDPKPPPTSCSPVAEEKTIMAPGHR